jgi:hypothetical protein
LEGARGRIYPLQITKAILSLLPAGVLRSEKPAVWK